MTTAADTWGILEQRMQEFNDLARVGALLQWDHETYMSHRGAEARARQQATMRVVRHERLVDDRLGEQLDELADSDLDLYRAAMVRNLRRERDRAARLPMEFVRRLALAESLGTSAWRIAREEDNFELYRPALEEIVAVKREEADLVGLDGERYDSLLDEYEPGMRVSRLEPLLGDLRRDLGELLGAIVSSPRAKQPAAEFIGRSFPDQVQWDFTVRLLADLGFDLEAGRQDRSAHPFSTTMALHDVRVTTRIHEHEPFDSIFSTIHECGHALYEQGFDPAWEGTPIAEAPSLGLHESQSRMWENIVGRSAPFWEHYCQPMREAFPDVLNGVTPEDLYREVNRVHPSLIRVDSDEVTYNLHILIRFELELALMREELEVVDLPGAWNDSYERTLGVRPPSDAQGVMQDIHWSSGSMGYFPTYTLGNLYSAILWDAYAAQDPQAASRIGAGDFAPLLSWLRKNVHRPGYLYLAEDLVRNVTGSGLTHEPFMRYLWAKYGPLYDISR
jgi:carboxypeptidase Taq